MGWEYFHTFPIECGHFSPNVGKYTIHGSYGSDVFFFNFVTLPETNSKRP